MTLLPASNSTITSADFDHHVALLRGVDAEHERVGRELSRAHAEHGPAAGEVVEQHQSVEQHQWVVVRHRVDAGAETDAAGPLARGGQDHLGTGDRLVPRRVVLADPRLVEAELLDELDQLDVAPDLQCRVDAGIVMRRDEGAES